MKRTVPIAIAFAMVMQTVAAGPASAKSLVAGSYEEAIRCAAINTLLFGYISHAPANGSKISEEDKALARTAQDHAAVWLVIASAINPSGKDSKRALKTATLDLENDVVALNQAVRLAPDSDALEKVIGDELRHCVEREATIFPQSD